MVRVGVFAADDKTAAALANELHAHGLQVAARATVADTEVAITEQMNTWIDDDTIDVVITTTSVATRAALVPLVTKRLLGFSDLTDVDGGRCDSTIVILVASDAPSRVAALEHVLSRLENELARKPAGGAGGRPKVRIPTAPPVAPAKAPPRVPAAPPPVPTASSTRGNVAAIPPASPARGGKPPPVPPRIKTPPIPFAAIPPRNKTIQLEDADLDAKPKRGRTIQLDDAGLEALSNLDKPPLPQPQSSSSKRLPSLPSLPKVPPSEPASVVVGDEPTPSSVANDDPPSSIAVAPDDRIAKSEPSVVVAAEPSNVVAAEPSIVDAADERVAQSEPSIVVAAEPSIVVAADERVATSEPSIVVSDELSPVVESSAARSSSNATPTPVSAPPKAPPTPSASGGSARPPAAPASKPPAPPATAKTPPSSPAITTPAISQAPAAEGPAVDKSSSAADKVAAAVDLVGAPRSVSAYPATPSSKRGLLYALIAIVVLGGAAAAFVMLGKRAPKPRPPVASSDKPIDKPLDHPSADPGSADDSEASATADSDDIEIEIDDPSTTGSAGTTGTRTTGTRTTGTRTTGTRTTDTRTTDTRTTGTTGTTDTPTGTTTPTTTTQTTGAVSADGCDKVSCVIDNFARPCCDPFRPRKAGEIPYELDKSMITTGMSKGKAVVIRCGEQNAAAKGIVKITVTVAGDGRVTEAAVAESPDPALGTCVANAVRKLTFAKTDTGGSFTYPFKF